MRVDAVGTFMRLALAAAILALGQPAFAQATCRIENAIYAERENGYELRFHKGKPWEFGGMIESVFELVMPDGTKLWGNIASNMGASRDVGRLYHGCPAPTADEYVLDDEVEEYCRQWEGVVYSLEKGEPGFMPGEGGEAPDRILMTDLGRKIRYSGLVESPGDEPWDVFDFKRCVK
jgi:hypothetical protein